ncbi:heat shock 70 kDa protein 16 isoform X2 [Gossypium arboreum]|uniref:heat shock 70 kDa protein 16 isoform X2 n=1 Tax=Gossypium arboreum TaxID=29729 RepID=UPI0022F199C9|nr:heat shock 70 kDa protein 16 isoform X2 [Gossypium arboreum]
MSVVGLDIGNENCIIAVAKQRSIDVLLNEESKRETPAAVSFGEKQRFIGSAGAASATMNPRSTILQVKRLIGRKFNEPGLEKELKLFPFETFESPDGGILIRLQFMGEVHEFTPIQILGMLLSHLKQIAEKNLEMPVSECVIGIPSYFTDLQRRAYLDAAAIAGLKPLRLLHDCTATALGYGIYKTDISNSSPVYTVFVDIGHCDTQICIALFETGQMKIISHAFDCSLGGRDFDEVLFNHFASQFKERYNIDVFTNIKASVRLRASCEKLKKVLSANAEAPLNIECLMDEKDVRGLIKREEFEKLSSDLLERITVPCRKVLADSGLTLDKINSVELVGSGSRIPAITRILASIFNREPSRTINASECVARGCALQCAMLSPIFRVREYEVQDSLPLSIGFLSDKGPVCTLSNGVLFPKGHPFPSVKILTLHRTNMFNMEAFYVNSNELPSKLSPQINTFTIGPIQCHTNMAKVKVRVQLNLHGIVKLDSAVAGVARRGKAVKRLEIPISESVCDGMKRDEIAKAEEKERWLMQQDLKMEQTKDKKNALESYVYEMRDKILNAYRSFANESDREEISRKLQQTEDWLYEDGMDETENVYVEKLEDLKKLVDPIENRYKDEEARVQAAKDLLKCIEDYWKAAASLSSIKKDAVTDECNKAERWLQEKSQQQDSLPKDVDPMIWSCEIKRKMEALEATCKYMIRSNASRDDMNVTDQGDKSDGMQ